MPVRLSGRWHKYGAQPIVIDGQRFDSKREAAYFGELKLREKIGDLTHLERQVPVLLTTVDQAGERQQIGHLVVDFKFADASGEVHWQDVKGFMTPLAEWKLRHCKAEHGIEVEIVK